MVDEQIWTPDKPVASLSNCHLGIVALDGTLVKRNIVKSSIAWI